MQVFSENDISYFIIYIIRHSFCNFELTMLNKKIKIGSGKLDVIDLCRPCRHLSEKLGRDDIIKEFLRKGGIRCQIINDGK